MSGSLLRNSVHTVRLGGVVHFGVCWFALAIAVLLLVMGLWNATLLRSEKGFYAMALTLSLFAAIAVQKGIRDQQSAG